MIKRIICLILVTLIFLFVSKDSDCNEVIVLDNNLQANVKLVEKALDSDEMETLQKIELPQEQELVRHTLGFDDYYFSLTIVDKNNQAIENIEIIIDGIIVQLDKNNKIHGFVDSDEIEVLINAPGFITYYDEIDISSGYYIETIILEKQNEIYHLLNNTTLHPFITDDNNLNEFIDCLFLQLFTPTMTTYHKVLACYNWLIENTYYEFPEHWKRPYQDYYWSCAYQCLVDGFGTCNCYSAAFTAMLRKIGFEAYIVEGETVSRKGDMTSHQWVVVVIDGKQFIFDPQVEDAIMNRLQEKEITYVRFCLSVPDSKYKYNIKTGTKEFQKYLDAHGKYIK